MKMTYEEFRAVYAKNQYKWPWWANLIPTRDFARGEGWILWPRWWGLAFSLRIRYPDRQGCFGPGHGGWCFPWQWYRKYWEQRCRT
jgi:hypothetical protein